MERRRFMQALAALAAAGLAPVRVLAGERAPALRRVQPPELAPVPDQRLVVEQIEFCAGVDGPPPWAEFRVAYPAPSWWRGRGHVPWATATKERWHERANAGEHVRLLIDVEWCASRYRGEAVVTDIGIEPGRVNVGFLGIGELVRTVR